jgi:hypothetical protein
MPTMPRESVGVDAIPVALVQRLLTQEEGRLATRARELTTLRESLAGLSQRAARVLSPPSHPDLVVAADLPLALGERQQRDRAWLSVSAVLDSEGTAGLYRDLDGIVDRAASRRTIYPASVLESPFCLRQMRSRMNDGERQRLGTGPAVTFAVVDDTVVIPEGEDYRVVADPGVVSLAVRLFDLAWSGSIEPPDDEEQGSSDAMILALLSRGLKDEAIGRYLGLSLRTVRRRVAAMMDRFGAGTRFELGVRVAESGIATSRPPGPAPSSAPPWARTRLGARSESR